MKYWTERITQEQDILCKTCGLNVNQLPLWDKRHRKTDVLWVGLSAKLLKGNGEQLPLSGETNTGKILNKIENGLTDHTFIRTNLVKCVPLDYNNKLRYPTSKEMNFCFDNLENEISTLSPRLVILLGLKVCHFILKKIYPTKNLNEVFNYTFYDVGNTIYLPIHHPSYIHVYKRTKIDLYVTNIQKQILTLTASRNSKAFQVN